MRQFFVVVFFFKEWGRKHLTSNTGLTFSLFVFFQNLKTGSHVAKAGIKALVLPSLSHMLGLQVWSAMLAFPGSQPLVM